MSDAKISLGALFALQGRMEKFLGSSGAFAATKTALEWADEQGFLTDRPIQPATPHHVEWIFVGADMGTAVVTEEIPAGPQDDPEGPAAGDLTEQAVASDDLPGPEGAEVAIPSTDEAPASPVAGGDAPQPEKKSLPPLWTEEEDATAVQMRAEGHTVAAIAARLGRPEGGAGFRISKILKGRIEAAMSKQGGLSAILPTAEAVQVEPAKDDQPLQKIAAQPHQPVGLPDEPGRPSWWRVAADHLNALGHRKPHTPATDLQLAEDVLKGLKLDVIAADMLISAVDLKNRWRALLSAVGTPEGNRPTIDEQEYLLQILRFRAGKSKQQAAE